MHCVLAYLYLLAAFIPDMVIQGCTCDASRGNLQEMCESVYGIYPLLNPSPRTRVQTVVRKCTWIPIRNVGICNVTTGASGAQLLWLILEGASFPERKVCVTKHNYWSNIIVCPDNEIRDGPRDRLHHICDNAAIFQQGDDAASASEIVLGKFGLKPIQTRFEPNRNRKFWFRDYFKFTDGLISGLGNW